MKSFANYLKSEGLGPRTVQCYVRVSERVGSDPEQWLRNTLADAPVGTACVYKAAVRHWLEFRGDDPIKMPRGRRRKRKQRFPLSEIELARWYRALKSEPDPARTVLEILPKTGMRVSELCTARRNQLVQRGDAWGIVVIGKGEHERWVPLSKSAIQNLESYLTVPLQDFVSDEDEDVIFVGRNGNPISANWVREVARNVSNKIGVECSPHVLRHTWATRAHHAGVPQTDIQAVLGHVSPATTQIYLHADDRSKLRAVEMADLLE